MVFFQPNDQFSKENEIAYKKFSQKHINKVLNPIRTICKPQFLGFKKKDMSWPFNLVKWSLKGNLEIHSISILLIFLPAGVQIFRLTFYLTVFILPCDATAREQCLLNK